MAASTATAAPRTGSISRSGTARTALAIVMPAGPLAIAAVRGILPYTGADSNTAMAAKVAAHPGAELAVIWLTFIALLTLIPGVIALGMLARRHSPRLGTIGLVLAYAAFACLFWSSVAGSDTVSLSAARAGLHPATTGALLTALGNITPIGLGTAIFVFGHIIGLVILAIALWRGRAVPTWAAVLLAVSPVLHFIFVVVVPVQPLDALAWALSAPGFAAAGLALARESAAGRS